METRGNLRVSFTSLNIVRVGIASAFCSGHRAQSSELRAQAKGHRAQSTEHRAQSMEKKENHLFSTSPLLFFLYMFQVPFIQIIKLS